MHVLQVSGFPPNRIGGTEIYIAGLVRGLASQGVRSTLVVPLGDLETPVAEHAGAPVETYPVNTVPSPEELRKGAPHRWFDEFRNLLARHPGAIYHQHSWTRGNGAPHISAAKAAGMRTVFTVHTPSIFCLRGDMMRFGQTPCNGQIDTAACSNCWSRQRGAPDLLARILSHVPQSASRAARMRSGRLATAIAARALAVEKAEALRNMIHACDRIVAVCSWVYHALILNGIPPSKICLSRQGVSDDIVSAVRPQSLRRNRDGTLRLVYFGSWNPLKGVDVAVRAVRALPAETDVQLAIHAPRGGPVEQAYEQRVRALAGGDARINFHGPVERTALAAAMAEHDVLIIPSVWLETGPLVALEAQAAGLYVMGSRLGGIAELVNKDNGGMLVAPGNVPAWASAIAEMTARRQRERLPAHMGPVRTMRIVSEEMANLYRSLEWATDRS